MSPPSRSPAADPRRIGGSGEAESGSRLWRHESQATMRTMAVVVIDVGVQDALKLAMAGDQDPVKAFAPHGADEALGTCVGLWSVDRCSDDLDPLAAEDLVQGAAELRVAIVDQEAWRRGSVGERPPGLARRLRDPDVAWMLGAARCVDPAATKLDEEQDVEPCREDGVDGEEVAREHARRLAADELAPGNAGSLASGPEACFAQGLADRRRRDAEPQRPELARDPLLVDVSGSSGR